jgi:release factor glutamine methyltransferase
MQQSFDYISQSLSHLYSKPEAGRLAMLIMEHITQFSQAKILTNKNTILSDTQHEKVQLIVERLKKNEPLQYILGESEFYGLNFEVNPATLIPRPETEELVDWIIADQQDLSQHILDIGTGTGCIAISLAKNIPNSIVTAFDVSLDALETANKNASLNQVKVDFKEYDILQKENHFNGVFDIIVSNPPYVCEKEKTEMKDNVLKYEPHLALFVPDNDPLLFYRSIAHFARTHLTENGSLYFEINRAFGKETCDMLAELGFSSIQLKKDLSGNDRMIKALK